MTLEDAIPIVVEYESLIAGRPPYVPGGSMPIFPYNHAQLCQALDMVLVHAKAALPAQ